MLELISNDSLFVQQCITASRVLLPTCLFIFACFVLILYPQHLQLQQQRKMHVHIRPGARIVTMHGLIGTVCHTAHNVIILELNDGRKIEISTQMVARVDGV